MRHRLVAADAVQQVQAVVIEAPPRDLEESAVVAETHVLEHAHRENPVEALVQLAVVLYADLHRQPGAQLARERGLLLRDGDAHATDAVALRRELQRLAPAAADVEHAHPLAQPELAADQVELGKSAERRAGKGCVSTCKSR